MKTLYRTEKLRTTSSNMGDGERHEVEAWFELWLHDGPADPTTWEGGGQTVAYWREQFARQKDPTRWAIRCARAGGIADAVVPDEIVRGLPDDARISFIWTVCQV